MSVNEKYVTGGKQKFTMIRKKKIKKYYWSDAHADVTKNNNNKI